ncbi:superoxide dismutase [Ni] [Symmachiella dynata]|uniref:superoxide dismutase [Ni] n=1 Tax=Symmachiella dynata TaxID=2527995 RepID=UPI0030EB3DD3
MSRFVTLSLALAAVSLVGVRTADAHCQVPCGIYGDQTRFEQMLEDFRTISKAMTQINELSEKSDAQSKNQLVRWINTKEEHASKTQKIMAEYFFAQRIKSDNEAYVKQLKAAHNIIVTAMKCKQTVDPKVAESLEKAIYDFYRVYEGKEPDFEH